MSALSIHSLGTFWVARDGTAIQEEAWVTLKNKNLLKILLTHRGRPLSRDQLIEWLWYDLAPAAAARNLRVAISQLRRILEPELAQGARSNYIHTTESSYLWNTQANYWLDADEFQRSHAQFEADANAATGERAKALYCGDYLEQDRYADWASVERERLRESYFALLTRLADVYARQSQYRRAVALCREVLAADRCRESVWCQLMLYHYHAGDQALALRTIQECRQVLDAELGVAPLPETIRLAEEIGRREVAGATVYPPPASIERGRNLPLSLGRTPFVGRESEYARLVDHLEQARAGRGRVVLIEGEAGIGKTRLAEEVLGYARQHGTNVLEGYCRQLEGSTPLQLLVETLRGAGGLREFVRQALSVLPQSLISTLAILIPELQVGHPDLPTARTLPHEQEKTRLFEALTQLLLQFEPAILFLDDLQWADTLTLEFLEYFAPRLTNAAVLVLGTFRSEEVGEAEGLARLLLTLKRRGAFYTLALSLLSSDALVQLLQALSRSKEQGERLGQQLYHETEGNPLFLVSILQALFESGLLVADEAGVWSGEIERDRRAMPTTMQQLILGRLERLDEEARQVLEAAAVLGREFQWQTLSHMRAWRRDVLLDHLDELERALLIRERGQSSYAFGHDKIREVIYSGFTDERRGWLHSKAGEALETIHSGQLDPVAAALAFHFQQAGRYDRACIYRLRAGEFAARLYASAEAIGHYRAALDLANQSEFQPPNQVLPQAYERLGDLYQAAGQYAAAGEQFRAALAQVNQPDARIRLVYKLAHNSDRQGQRGRALELLGQAVQEVKRLGAEQVGYLEAARVYARWAILNAPEHGLAEAEHYTGLAMSIIETKRPDALQRSGALSPEEYDVVHTVLINSGEAFRFCQHWTKAAAFFEQSLGVAERQQDPVGIGYSCHNLGDVLLAEGACDRARACYERAAEAFVKSSQTWEQMASRTHLGLAWACEGNWDQAIVQLEHARAIGEQMEPTGWLGEVYLWLALAALRSGGNADQAREYRERAAAVAQTLGQPLPSLLWNLALSAAEACAGRPEVAREYYTQARTWAEQELECTGHTCWIFRTCGILRQCAPPDA